MRVGHPGAAFKAAQQWPLSPMCAVEMKTRIRKKGNEQAGRQIKEKRKEKKKRREKMRMKDESKMRKTAAAAKKKVK